VGTSEYSFWFQRLSGERISPAKRQAKIAAAGDAYEPAFPGSGRTDRPLHPRISEPASGPLRDRHRFAHRGARGVPPRDLILATACGGLGRKVAPASARGRLLRDRAKRRVLRPQSDGPQIRTNGEAPASCGETIAQPDAQGLKAVAWTARRPCGCRRALITSRAARVARTARRPLMARRKITRLPLAGKALSYRAIADDVSVCGRLKRPGFGSGGLAVLDTILGTSDGGDHPRKGVRWRSIFKRCWTLSRGRPGWTGLGCNDSHSDEGQCRGDRPSAGEISMLHKGPFLRPTGAQRG